MSDQDVAEAIEAVAARVARTRGWRARVAEIDGQVWVEFAAPTAAGRCPRHGWAPTGPAWEVVDAGEVVGNETAGACPVDRARDAGWMRSGARPAGELAAVLGLATEFLSAELAERHDLAVEQLQRLETQLDRALLAVEAGRDPSTVVTSAGDSPGVAVHPDGRGLYAWAWDPRSAGAALVAGPRRPRPSGPAPRGGRGGR